MQIKKTLGFIAGARAAAGQPANPGEFKIADNQTLLCSWSWNGTI